MTTKHSSIHLSGEGQFDTTSTDSLAEMRSLVATYADDPNGAVLEGWEPREGTIITEVRAISARINQNYDAWPSEELKSAHHTFVGKPVFINHNNHDPDRARGRVVASRYVDAGEEDRYIQVLQEVEASRFPMLAKELMEGGLDSVSMGAEAREVECSYCGNISTSPFDACEHIAMKGATLPRKTANGQEDVLVYEICRKIGFFELSYVFDPADETAVASNVLVASREALNSVTVPPNVDTLHPDEDEKSDDDWHEYIDDPNVIDTIDVLDEPDLGLNQQLERPDDEVPEGFEEFEGIDEQIEENEQAEADLARDSREKAQEKSDKEGKDPEDEKNWDEEPDGAGGTIHRFKGAVEAMVSDDYGTFNMWVEKNGSLIASDSYTSLTEAKQAAIRVAKFHTKEKNMTRTSRRKRADQGTAYKVYTNLPEESYSVHFEDGRLLRFDLVWERIRVADEVNIAWFDKGHFGGTFDENGVRYFIDSQIVSRKQAGVFAPGDKVEHVNDGVKGTVVVTDPRTKEVTVDWEDGEESTEPVERLTLAASRKQAGHRTADIASDDQDFKDYLSELLHPPTTPDELDVVFYDDFLVTERPNLSQHSVDYIGDMIVDSPEDYYFTHTPTYSSRRNGKPRVSRTKNRETSRRSNRMAPQRRRRIGDNNKQTPLLEETGIAQTPAPEPVALPDEGDSAPNNTESDRVKAARRALAREIARDRTVRARRKRAGYEEMSDYDLIEMHGELENDAQDGDDSAIAQMEKIEAEAEKRGLDLYDPNFDPNERAFMSRRRRAKAVGDKLSNPEGGEKVKREDLFQNYPATTMTAKVRRRFASWVQSNYGCSLREASSPGELRSWARAFSRQANIEMNLIHSAIRRDVQALRTAADDDEGVKGDEIPDFIEDKIEESGDNPSKEDVEDKKKESRRRAARRAAMRRRAMQARQGRGRRNQTSRRRTADEKLDVAAPGDRVNVEKPTSGTTDADAEASQFDRSDFDNNSGKGLENPDNTGTPGTPGGPSVNDLKKSSRATGLQAVRLAEAMIAAGLIEDSNESKYKAAAQYEKMSRDIVLDRTALLEKVAKQSARRSSATKSAGNRGTSLNSAVPPNLSAASRPAPQRREASSDNDSDLFF